MNHFWLDKHIKQWHETIEADRKPQAVIINGVAGVGKIELLKNIIADLLCRESTPACGKCQNCRLYSQGYHPDVDHLTPDKDLIKVKMIRELTEFFVSTPHCSDHKLAVITDAHLMNAAAANALLKVLEEPPSKGLLFLTTDSKHKLMPTIRSRCITLDVVLKQSEKQQLPEWINSQGNYNEDAILHALLLADWQPLSALKLLDSDGVVAFTQFLDLIHQALTAQQSISESAKLMVATDDIAIWHFLYQYLISWLNQYCTQIWLKQA